MKIKDIKVRKVFDSRGQETVQFEILGQDGRISLSQVPAGKSTGEREVKVLPVETAYKVVKSLRPKMIDRDFHSIRHFDDALLELDGTPDKKKIGGNVALGASIAVTRAFASESKREVWQEVRDEFFPKVSQKKLPMLFSNLINGGAHAKNGLDIQEYMAVAVPKKNITDSVSDLIALYKKLGEVLRKKNPKGVLPIGDEGGYAVGFKNNLEPLVVLSSILSDTSKTSFKLALDVAASSFFNGKEYSFDGKNISSAQLSKHYLSFAKRFSKLISIEDPFSENDFSSFAALKKLLPKHWVVGDDLTTTNPESIAVAGDNGFANGVIIKPNQIGSVSSAADAIQVAFNKKMGVIVSHRSGEVEDNFIIHLARAANADALKIGAPCHERIYKFDEAVRIYE